MRSLLSILNLMPDILIACLFPCYAFSGFSPFGSHIWWPIFHPNFHCGLFTIGYPKKLDRLTEIIELNGKVTDGIVTAMKRSYTLDSSASWDAWLALSSTYKEPLIDSRCLSRIREVLKHFVRDWSDAGLSERTVIFEPILSVLSMLSSSSRAHKRVLVPGSGLCRLAYDISTLGYDTTACELSGYMNGAFRFLLDPETTTTTSQHEVHPYGHWWSHSRNIVDLFRGVRFPDVIPRLAMDAEVGLHLKEGDFLTLELGTPNSYDYVVTLFFIDTSVNILSTLERIHTLLKPGGIWINLGPLLWCSDAQARLELSLEEVFEAMGAVGFVIVGGTDGNDDDEPDCMKRRSISCEYTHDEQAMMRWIYEAEFWVAKKV
ncbi:N2227-like protein-domain-containing protein [Rhodocollybia butyracea]|uniref:N2227-like protein-domain-containing protein n=1 Tax=Rhodocollybia butyracea TaxID=206335 RepID=A0A9P5UDU4_9AGAR|nr:N2227-like protein-domain-containing protein [Rhodocollybia butyracea]